MSKNLRATKQNFSCENYRPLHTSQSWYMFNLRQTEYNKMLENEHS